MFALLAGLLALAACAPAPVAVEISAVPITTITQARQASAPVVWPQEDGFIAAWIGEDAAGVHQDARRIINDVAGPVVVLPLPPRHPYRQSAAPAAEDNLHLVWMDANEDGENRLYSAILNTDLDILRGPTLISTQPTLNYGFAVNSSNGLWIIWSGGLVVEPTLYSQLLDNDGRPQEPQRILNGDWPALIRTQDGTYYLYWIDLETDRLMLAVLVEGLPGSIATLTANVPLDPGDRIVDVSVAQDSTYIYFIWNITRANGSDESWLTYGDPSVAPWPTPEKMTVALNWLDPAASGETDLRWATPLTARRDPLPILAQARDRMAIMHLHGGDVTDFGPLTSATSDLVGPVNLYTAPRTSSYAAWSEPTNHGTADLNVAHVPQ